MVVPGGGVEPPWSRLRRILCPLRKFRKHLTVCGPDRDRTDDLFHAMEARIFIFKQIGSGRAHHLGSHTQLGT